MRALALVTLLVACGGKDADTVPVDTAVDGTGSGGGTLSTPATTTPSGTGGTDVDTALDTGTATTPAVVGPAGRRLILTEICDDDLVDGLAWLELYNSGEAAVDLGDYSLRVFADGGTTPTDVALPHRALPAGRAWVVVQGGWEDVFVDTWGRAADQAGLPFTLDGDDSMFLFDRGELVDAFGVIGEGFDSPWAYPMSTATREDGILDGSASWDAGQWVVSFGAAFATPGRHPSSAPLPTDPGGTGTSVVVEAVVLSEVTDLASDADVKYVELYNAGFTAADLSGWSLNVYDAAAAEPATVQLAGVLAPGAAYVVAGAESADAFYATFGFHADLYSSVAFGNGNDPVQVTGPLGQIDTFGQVGADGFGQPWDYTDSAAVRLPGVLEGAAEWVADEWTVVAGDIGATPGEHGDGSLADPGVLWINEIVDHAEDDAVRWVELYNPGPDPAMLSRFVIHRYANGSPLSATVRLSGELAPGDVWVVAGDAGTFLARYGFDADQADPTIDGDGNDVYELRLDGVPLDVYGEPGVDGFGTPWEYTDSVVRRDPIVTGPQDSWLPEEWRVTAGSAGESPGMR